MDKLKQRSFCLIASTFSVLRNRERNGNLSVLLSWSNDHSHHLQKNNSTAFTFASHDSSWPHNSCSFFLLPTFMFDLFTIFPSSFHALLGYFSSSYSLFEHLNFVFFFLIHFLIVTVLCRLVRYRLCRHTNWHRDALWDSGCVGFEAQILLCIDLHGGIYSQSCTISAVGNAV